MKCSYSLLIILYLFVLFQAIPSNASDDLSYKVTDADEDLFKYADQYKLSLRNSKDKWTFSFDLDGDGVTDLISYRFSGGAHCCYYLEVHLSLTRKTHQLPFELDGGYVGGLDLGLPDQFDVRVTDGSLPELVMEIETYNGKPRPIPEAWKRKFGFKTNYIAVGFAGGKLRIRDWPQQGQQERN